MEVYRETIGPEKAEEYLKANTKNRNLRKTLVKRYAREMQEGRWDFNGEALKFDTDGTLLDGQHRLTAVVLAEVELEFLVIRNLHPETRQTIDTGGPRRASDVLTFNGYKNHAASLASAAKYLHSHLNGTLTSYASNNREVAATNQEVLDIVQDHSGLEESIEYIYSLNRLRGFYPAGMASFLHFVFRKEDPELADSFFRGLYEGVGLEADTGLYHLRNRLLTVAQSNERLPPKDKIALVAKAWNKTRNDETVKVLRWGGNESFPEIG